MSERYRTKDGLTMAQVWCDAYGVERVPDDYPSPLECFIAENSTSVPATPERQAAIDALLAEWHK